MSGLVLRMAAQAARQIAQLPQVRHFWPRCGFTLHYSSDGRQWIYEIRDDVPPVEWV